LIRLRLLTSQLETGTRQFGRHSRTHDPEADEGDGDVRLDR
jgi:hypothetical protein